MKKNLKGGNANTLPLEYFGGNSGRYFIDSLVNVGKDIVSGVSGSYLPQSFGTVGAALGDGFTGPNLFPHPLSSGVQTGGRRRRRSRKTKRANRKVNKKAGCGTRKTKRCGNRKRRSGRKSRK